jgi:uncharacterized protein with HEPN domain
MQLEVRKYLFDIQKACALISQFTAGKDLSAYSSDILLRSAVERQFEIIGEALSRMLKLDSALGARITASRQIVSFRNVLIHGYATILNDLVWEIIEAKLPILQQEVDQLLGEQS